MPHTYVARTLVSVCFTVMCSLCTGVTQFHCNNTLSFVKNLPIARKYLQNFPNILIPSLHNIYIKILAKMLPQNYMHIDGNIKFYILTTLYLVCHRKGLQKQLWKNVWNMVNYSLVKFTTIKLFFYNICIPPYK